MESPLACNPSKAEPFLHLRLTYRNLYALQTKTISKQSALISLESSKCSIVAHTQLSATAFGGFISSLPFPTSQPTSQKCKQEEKGAGKLLSKTTSSFQACGCAAAPAWKRNPRSLPPIAVPRAVWRNITRHQLTLAITSK